MGRVTGIGGIVITAKDPQALQSWYRDQLGVDVQAWGGTSFDWTDADGQPIGGTTAWSIVADDDESVAPSVTPFMVNYRVEDLPGLLASLKQAGATTSEDVVDSEYGAFGWVLDPEGNKVELWEPISND